MFVLLLLFFAKVGKKELDQSHVSYCPHILFSVMRNMKVVLIGILHADAQTRIAFQVGGEERWRGKRRGFYEE